MWMELDRGQKNPMLEAAQAISITGGKTPEEVELDRLRGEKVADDWRDDPRFARPEKEDRTELVATGDGQQMPRWLVEGDDVAGENDKGSYEALLSGWGMSAHGKALDVPKALVEEEQ